MNKTKKYLTCTNVMYYGARDEEMFFEWVKMIDCIEGFDKVGDDLYLYLKHDELSDDDLYEILSFFKRYNIDMKQLRSFLTKETKKSYSKDKDAYWYRPLFSDD